MSWSDERESGSLHVDGKLVIDADGNVVRLEGRSLDLLYRAGDAVRQITLTNRDGQLQKRMLVDGKEQPWEPEGARWMSGFLIQLDRRSGFAIDTRFPKLYEKGGAAAVLDEVDQMDGDHARGQYLSRLAQTGPLKGPLALRLLASARKMRSDYELGRVLGALASKSDLSDLALRRELLAAASQMRSDYEKGRALQLVLARRDLTADLAADALGAASRMRSDYEKGRALKALAPKLPAGALDAYVATVRSMHSDYERAQSLWALLAAHQAGKATLRAVVSAVTVMRSDYEAARVLVAVAEQPKADDDVRSEIATAARRLRSGYERQRVLASVHVEDPRQGR
jgi:hypothetical protein